MATQNFPIFLGPANSGADFTDYTLTVFTADGTPVVTTDWEWAGTIAGGYVVTIPTAAPGGTYHVAHTIAGTPWAQGTIPTTASASAIPEGGGITTVAVVP